MGFNSGFKGLICLQVTSSVFPFEGRYFFYNQIKLILVSVL